MTNLTTAEKNKLDNTCGNLRATKLGTHIKELEDFVNKGTLNTTAKTVVGAINELYSMILNNEAGAIQVPPPGFFTLFGDGNGRLICYYNDEDHPPQFRHVTDSTANDYGSLYLQIADPQSANHYEVLVGNFIPANTTNYYTKSEIDDMIEELVARNDLLYD